MKLRILTALAALTLSLAVPAAASDVFPPHAGSRDDASYGDMPRASFGVELPRPDGRLSLASSGDDANYGTSREATAPAAQKVERVQVASCSCGR
ncbi:hypothetical protein [Anaeromyxobacter terrae]|uniref:hypothetical protein n=1 Tax=Anaeromyxobacter terrae TaxID=2925406 RepID=UPI001F59D2ED|nr:hypothetical protein [Anaeromyxobacter sp. SG22]